MAVIAPTLTAPRANSNGLVMVDWTQINQDDTGGTATLAEPVRRGAALFAGTFDTGTYTLRGSFDGTLWATVVDTGGTDVAATADSYFDFDSLFTYFDISVAGGTTEDVDVQLVYQRVQ